MEIKHLTLCTSDGATFEVPEGPIVAASPTIKALVDSGDATKPISVPNVTGPILSRVLDYVHKHFAGGGQDDFAYRRESLALRQFDEELVQVGWRTVLELVTAAAHLKVRSLEELVAQAIADRIKDKTPEEIRKMLNIVNDLTEEQEAEIRRENAWAFK